MHPAACQWILCSTPLPMHFLPLWRKENKCIFLCWAWKCAADGGLLLLNDRGGINGKELAQALVRRRVKLAVFNACWERNPINTAIERYAQQFGRSATPSRRTLRVSHARYHRRSRGSQFHSNLYPSSRPADEHRRSRYHCQTTTPHPLQVQPTRVDIACPLYAPRINGEIIVPITEAITEIPSISQAIPPAYMRSLSFHTHPISRFREG